MEEISALAAAEVVSVLYNTEVSLVVKLPYKLLKSFEDKAAEYGQSIVLKENASLDQQDISDEARSILLILYREFLCDSEKKKELDRAIIEHDKQVRIYETEKFDPFKDSKKDSPQSEDISAQTTTENTDSLENSSLNALIELPKKWYVRIFDRIVKFFRKK